MHSGSKKRRGFRYVPAAPLFAASEVKRSADVFVSELVISEASKGHPEAAQRRLVVIADLPLLKISSEARSLAQTLIQNHALPPKAEVDAYHVAIAVVNGAEYLLTWNCTHIANAHTRPRIEATCRALGYEPPVICTPLELTEE